MYYTGFQGTKKDLCDFARKSYFRSKKQEISRWQHENHDETGAFPGLVLFLNRERGR